MYKIKQKDINDKVTIIINGMETDYKFDTEYDIDENTRQILTDAGYEIEEIKKDEVTE